jgi:uncharacterized membrane protein YraQ (UPF0718 family)
VIANRKKTQEAVKIAVQMFLNILPAFIIMLILLSISLFLIPDEIILRYLGKAHKGFGVFIASILGSVTFMPGFIVFPLCGILLKKGVSYMVLSAFSTTLMLVGILTYPIESSYFGVKVTILRNVISFFVALIVALMTGIFFGEVF